MPLAHPPTGVLFGNQIVSTWPGIYCLVISPLEWICVLDSTTHSESQVINIALELVAKYI